MTQVASPHAISVAPAPHSASVTQVESSKLLPWLMLTCILAAFAVGISILAVSLSQISERESRLAQEDLMYLRASLHARGIPTNHFEEEEIHEKNGHR
jgi:hypothetical protein